jgi:hypothetical protein
MKLKELFYKIPPFSSVKKQYLVRHDRHERMLRRLQAEVAVARYSNRLRELAGYFQPAQAVGVQKIRLGKNADGGYVMLDDFQGVETAYSLGIGDDVSWDADIAARGIPVRQYDHTVRRPPVQNPLFSFFPVQVESMASLKIGGTGDLVLKIDIEGAEWEFFDRASTEELLRFRLIAAEFHDFDLYHERQWWERTRRVLAKLHTTHQLVHQHANNASMPFWDGEADLPSVMELTYALRSRYRFEETHEISPGPLDFPNLPGIEDFPGDVFARWAKKSPGVRG